MAADILSILDQVAKSNADIITAILNYQKGSSRVKSTRPSDFSDVVRPNGILFPDGMQAVSWSCWAMKDGEISYMAFADSKGNNLLSGEIKSPSMVPKASLIINAVANRNTEILGAEEYGWDETKSIFSFIDSFNGTKYLSNVLLRPRTMAEQMEIDIPLVVPPVVQQPQQRGKVYSRWDGE